MKYFKKAIEVWLIVTGDSCYQICFVLPVIRNEYKYVHDIILKSNVSNAF